MIARGLVAADANKIAEGIGALRTEVVATVYVEFRVDGVQDVRAESIAIERRGGLQEIVLARSAGQVRRWNKSQQSLDRWVVHKLAGGNLLASGARRRKRRGGKRLKNRGAAEESAALGESWHRRKRVNRIFRGFMLVVDEKIGSVTAVVNVRNLQRAADSAADALVVAANLRILGSRNRERLRVEHGVRVAVENGESHAVDCLTKQSADLRAIRSATTTGTKATASAAEAATALLPEQGSASTARAAGTSCAADATYALPAKSQVELALPGSAESTGAAG